MRDERLAELAEQVQRRLPGWVIVPAPYHGGLSAFGACTQETTVIDATDPDALINQCRAAELAAAFGTPAAAMNVGAQPRQPTSPLPPGRHRPGCAPTTPPAIPHRA
ncbi:hypothetical protein [Actinoallomurus sp. NPDC052274]|uniref:hypothetical protein n=1 Tax=Actinoallomurus sp. NPDC052274 TaxID=3155420 RepID=UPI00343F64DD